MYVTDIGYRALQIFIYILVVKKTSQFCEEWQLFIFLLIADKKNPNNDVSKF